MVYPAIAEHLVFKKGLTFTWLGTVGSFFRYEKEFNKFISIHHCCWRHLGNRKLHCQTASECHLRKDSNGLGYVQGCFVPSDVSRYVHLLSKINHSHDDI